MLIDWFTVGAQLLNFALLVWLLKRLLYRRVLDAMDKRQEAILEEARRADARREKAEREAHAFQAKVADFEEGLATKTKAADEEVGAYRSRQLSKAREEVAEQRAAWAESLQRQHGEFDQELQRLVGEQICEAARKMVSDLAGVSLEAHMLCRFAGTLAADPKKRSALLGGGSELNVRTGFEVTAETRAEVRQILSEVLPPDAEVRFEQDDIAAGAGVIFKIGSFRLEWNAESYARSLANDVEKALASEHRKSRSAAVAQPTGK